MNELNLVKIATELLLINEDIKFRFQNPKETRITDFELHTFEQLWGNTSGGFEGFGGSAMTNQRTYVFVPFNENSERCIVYFGGRYAYHADYTEDFKEDLRNQNMVGISKMDKYKIV